MVSDFEFVAYSIPRADDCSRQYAFVQKVAIALKLSGINAVICIDGEEYKFFPYSEAFFDNLKVQISFSYKTANHIHRI